MKLLTILSALLSFQYAFSANSEYGVPFITHYSERDYYVSNNNHCIVQDQRGIMYFANEYGILEFDGNAWRILTNASNRSNIKSLAVDKNNQLYVGAQGDVGYLNYNQTWGFHFKSLVDKIPEQERAFEDVWNTIVFEDKVIFQSWKALFIYQNDTIEVFQTGKKIKGIFKARDLLFLQNEDGLYEFTDQELRLLSDEDALKNQEIKFILPFHKSEFLVGTTEGRFFILSDHSLKPMKLSLPEKLNEQKISAGHLMKDGRYVIGTTHHGIYILDEDGAFTKSISRHEGLQNNEVRYIFSDSKNNLWVANKVGIDFIELHTPFSLIKPDPEEPIGVFASGSYDDKLLFATHNGLLQYDPIPNDLSSQPSPGYRRVEGTPDINWNIEKFYDNFVVGHASGFSVFEGEKLQPLYSKEGGWTIKQLRSDPEYWIGGTYKGLIVFKNQNGKLKFINEIDGFDEPCRVVEIDALGNIWIAHGYKGIYRIRLNDQRSSVADLSFYGETKGLPSNLYNNVFKIWDRIMIGTLNGVYQYDEETDSMYVNKELTEILGNSHVRILQEDPSGNVWFVAGQRSGILKKHADDSFSIQTTPFNRLRDMHIAGFENFHFMKEKKTLIGTKDGVVMYDGAKETMVDTKIDALLRSVQCLRDSRVIYQDNIEFLCDSIVGKNIELPFKDNRLRFSFSSNFYENMKDVRYKYFLQGFDEDWSDWENISYKEYTNLHEGDYVFRLKAINIYEHTSEEVTFKFTILPPLHRTTLAYVVYILLLSTLIYLYMRIRNVRVEREKTNFIKEQDRLRQLDQAMFREDKLNKELEVKTTELSAAAMKVIYKNEKLIELKDKLMKIVRISSPKVGTKIKDLLAFVENELEDDDWDELELRFNQAHNNYINKLKEDYPNLTPKDLKMCAYLKMNLSSKEIANLLNMTIRGVENGRYRVRKRLGLDSSVNLTEWLLKRE